MIEEPVVGMKVRVLSGNCCSGHPRGSEGVIHTVFRPDSFTVEIADGCTYYHCRKCVEEVPDAV